MSYCDRSPILADQKQKPYEKQTSWENNSDHSHFSDEFVFQEKLFDVQIVSDDWTWVQVMKPNQLNFVLHL